MAHSAATFGRLHLNTVPLRLPNAWDAGSARLFAKPGNPGYRDNECGRRGCWAIATVTSCQSAKRVPLWGAWRAF